MGAGEGQGNCQVGALAFTPLFKILGLWLGSETRENPSPKLEAWSLSKTTYNNLVVLNFGARGNVRLSSGLELFFLSAPVKSTYHSGTSGPSALRQSRSLRWQ